MWQKTNVTATVSLLNRITAVLQIYYLLVMKHFRVKDY